MALFDISDLDTPDRLYANVCQLPYFFGGDGGGGGGHAFGGSLLARLPRPLAGLGSGSFTGVDMA